MVVAATLLFTMAPTPAATAQSVLPNAAEPSLISRVSSWLAAQVTGWFAEEPKGGVRPSGQKTTLPGRADPAPALRVAAPEPPGKRVKELTSQRTAVSKTFELEDGRRQVEISSQRVHVLDADGRWREADTRITKSGKGADDVAVSDGAGFTARFGSRSDRLVRVGLGDAQLTLGLAGEAREVQAEVSKSAVRYPGALGTGADLVYQVGAAGVKEQIVLSGPEAVRPSYAFTVQVADGLRAEARLDGSVAFTDAAAGGEGGPVFVIPPPFMTDASRSGKQAASAAGGFSTAITQSVTQQGNLVTLTLTPDEGWLKAAERSWPVVIDPTVVVQPDYYTSDDAMIVSYAPATNFGADARLGVSVDGSGPARSLVQFDLRAVVPPDEVIDHAEVGLYYDQVVGGSVTPMTLEAREVTQYWNWNSVTWNSISSAMGATPLSTTTFNPATPSVWNSWDVTALARRWVADPQNNHGVMIKAADESRPIGGPIYWAGEFLGSAEMTIPMPKLTLTYGEPGMRVEQPRIRHSTGAELTWQPYDGPGELTGYQVHRSGEPGFTPTTTTLVAPLGEDATGYQDTTAAPGTSVTYKVTALLADGTTVPSAPITVELPEVGWTTAMIEAAADTTLTTCDYTAGHDTLGGLPQLASGFLTGPYGNGRTLLRFDTGFIPAGAKVSSAEAFLYRVGYRGKAVGYATHPLTRAWDEASASWVAAAPGTAWTTPGSDYDPTPMEVFSIGPTATSAFLPLEVPVTVAQRWVDDPAANHGMMLRLTQEPSKSCPASGDGALFLSSEAAEPTVRPRLLITYLDPAVAYHAPATPPQLPQGQATKVRVTVTNPTTETWPAARTAVGYFWKLPDGTDVTGGSQLLTQLPADLPPGATATVEADVKAPTLTSANLAEAVSLVWDTQDTQTREWKSASHHLPQLPQQIRLTTPTSSLLGLEKFYAYSGKNTGAGGAALTNLYAGNVVWGYNAFSNPSRGVQTFARMTYNSLDTSSASLGYGWSLQTSTLTRLGSPLDFHPRGQPWPDQVRLTDGDGTEHVWVLRKPDGTQSKDCTLDLCSYVHPRGVHLLLQPTGSPDPQRQWVFTKPDRTQFFFDDEGFQSAIVDKNGNTMSFTYERRKSNNKPTKFLQYITDAAGRRTLTFDYHVKGQDYTYIDDTTWQPVEATKLTNPHIIDTVESITDIAGRTVTFAYTDKGLMARMIDGAGDDEAKTFGFRYDATQGNRNVKLVQVIDPRAHAEAGSQPYATKLDYYDAVEDPKNTWKVQTLTDRLNGPTGFVYVDPDGPQGGVMHATVTDPRGHPTRYVLDRFGRPDDITNAKDERTDLEWDDDHNVRALTEANGALTTWEYDQKTGYPLKITDAEANDKGTAPTTLTYQGFLNGFVADLVSKTSPMGNRPEAGTNPKHHTWQFGYDERGNLTSVTDPLGVLTADPADYTTRYTYDNLGQLQTAVDARGNTTTFGDYHPTGYPKKITDAKNNVTTTAYDTRGNVLSVTDALGKTTTQTYDLFKRPLESKVPKDQDASPPVLIVTPAPVYDRNDNVVEMTAPNGAVSTAAYDRADQLTTSVLPKDTTDGPERKATFTWDPAGNLKTQIEPKGHLPGANPAEYTTTYEYDPINQLTDVFATDVANNNRQNKITYEYDNVGNTVKVIDPRKNATPDPADRTALYTYDLNHRVRTVTDAAGFVTEVRYDLDGRVVEQQDQDRNVTRTDYNERDEVIRTSVPHADTPDGIKHVVTEYAYDPAGNRTKVITPRGVETPDDPADFVAETRYDELNRPVEQIYPFDPDDPVYNKPDSVFYAYDAVSRLKEISHPPSHGQSIRNVSKMTYWDNGWSKTTTDPWDIKTTYDYNPLGLQTNRTVTSAGGSSQRALDWSYYLDGKLKTHSDDGIPLGLDVVLSDNSDTGQTVTTGTWTLAGSGSSSNIVGPQTAVEGFVGYDYATAPAGTGTSSFTWNLTTPSDGTYKAQVRYPTGATATNAKYKVKHQGGEATVTLDQTQNPGTWVDLGTYAFTAGTGHTITLTDEANGTVAADAVKLVRDNSGESDAEKKDFTYTYDVNANLTKIEDRSPTAKIDVWDVAYTNLNQIEQIKEYLDGALKNTTGYRYNENSAVVERTHDKTIATYGYDVRDLVDEVVNKKSAADPSPKTTRYSYTSRGERFTETKANGNTVAYDYFLSGVLRHSLEKKPNGTVVAEHTIGYQGNLQRASDHAKVQNADNPGAYLDHIYAYTYDPRDRIAKSVKTPAAGGTAETETYSHDANSNVWEQEVLGKKTTFTYDRNRLMTSITDGATSTYTYDPYGRLRTIQAAGKTWEKYTYDGFDHVVKHEKLGTDGATSTVTSYTYDPLDRTTSKTEKEGTASAKTTTYSYLGLSAEVLDEEVAGKLTKSFQYSPWGERLSQVKVNADNTEESSYYGYNPHTDVEQITSDTGDTRATYGYTAYGKNDDKLFTGVDKPDPVDPTAKEEYNPYRFNAKRWDNSTGMYDMGFRNYNPGLNRFLNLDTYNGALADLSLGLDPWTANRYAFAGGNPINGIELDGHIPDDFANGKNGGYNGWLADIAKRNPASQTRGSGDHDKVVNDTVKLIQDKMDEKGISGRITVDDSSNKIPGANRDGQGGYGIADIILWTDDTIYIWEVKSKGGQGKYDQFDDDGKGIFVPNSEGGPGQLQRYIDKLQEQVGDGVQVVHGFKLDSSETVASPTRILDTWSGNDDGPNAGIRYYATSKKKRPQQPQPQPQVQEQEQEQPATRYAGPCDNLVALGPCDQLPFLYPYPGGGNPIPLPFSRGAICLPIPIPICL
ncbi:DNRLRE domain-containing protein [Nonomuraea gerenzanensis]|uniref:Rhs family protein n=1 Tax=Nonomuraea gerenzanensis TaxID=93944 RepID=A0A1M4ER46_9ACTN|nr:DNRLRE domain-containing protein [Nonomuraea gerenzanensis]UBU12526.1 DNRLRE domain-containing protein [Nonomuraea gerenzanensis]SBP01083.1 Rhs family protein [Nonomuraea gerenzanensis]